jgi:CRP-like cAMP-binding protein
MYLVVCRGVVQLFTIQQDGSETLLGLAGPSMPIGTPFTTVDPYWATALTDVDILALPMAEIESSPVLLMGVFRNLTLRLQQAEAWLALTGKRLVADRLKIFSADVGQRVWPCGTRWSTHSHPIDSPSTGDGHWHHTGNGDSFAQRV